MGQRNVNVFFDRDKDVTFYKSIDIMNEVAYKTETIKYCKNIIISPGKNKKNYNHLQLEILPYLKKVMNVKWN